MLTLLAEEIPAGEIRGIGPLGLQGQSGGCPGLPVFVDFFSKLIGVLTICAILWFVIQFILGGYKWLSSQGDSKSLEAARDQIMQSVIGLIFVLATLVILSVVGNIFGIDFLDLENLIKELSPGNERPC